MHSMSLELVTTKLLMITPETPGEKDRPMILEGGT